MTENQTLLPIAVVILNWNGRHLLEEFLPSVVTCTSKELAEIVVADNASTDDSLSFLATHYPQIRVIRLDENYGFAEGYNRALRQIDNQYVVLLNSDVEVTEGWLEPLYRRAEDEPTIAAIQPKIRAYRQKTHFEYAGACGGFIDFLGYPFCRGRVFQSLEEDHGQYDQPMDVFWATGAALFIRTCDFVIAGGFDSTFFAHMEEIDLCWRLNARGRRVVCEPSSMVYHLGAATLQKESPRKTYLNFRNNLLMLYKNLPVRKRRRTLAARLFLDIVAGAKMIVSGDFCNGLKVFQAMYDFYHMRRAYRPAHRLNMKKTASPIFTSIYRGSIVQAYFLQRKQKFSDVWTLE